MTDLYTEIDTYTPCRIDDCYFDDGNMVEILTPNGLLRLSSLGVIIWRLLDGKHSVSKIIETICLNAGVDTNELTTVLVQLLLKLESKGCIVMDWNPSQLRNFGW